MAAGGEVSPPVAEGGGEPPIFWRKDIATARMRTGGESTAPRQQAVKQSRRVRVIIMPSIAVTTLSL